MIFYFSGTGNTAYVAEELGRNLGDTVLSIFDRAAVNPKPDGASVGIVTPVYSWGIPPVMKGFIRSLRESGFWDVVKERNMHVWCVLTCGDEVALSAQMMDKLLSDFGIRLHSVWSVIMPNNYVLLPGFDVDPIEVAERKIMEAPGHIGNIVAKIKSGEPAFEVTVGSMPWLKTKLIYPLFKKWGIIRSLWHYTDACVGCGKCESVCSCGNIVLKDSRPTWGKNCMSCLACYHGCPKHAVAYGNFTKNKGQYHFPVKRNIPPFDADRPEPGDSAKD